MPNHNTPRLCFIGFGEAGQAIASGLRDTGIETIAAWDILFPARRGRQAQAGRRGHGRAVATSAADAARGADIIVSAVTAASSLEAARSVAPHLTGNPYFLDINSVSPGRKQETAEAARRQGALRRCRDPGADPSGAPPDAAAARRTARRSGDAAPDRRTGDARRHRRRRGRPGRRPEDDPQRHDQGHRGADAGMLPRRQALPASSTRSRPR